MANSNISTLLGIICQAVVKETIMQPGKVNLANKGSVENQNKSLCHQFSLSRTETNLLDIFSLFYSKCHGKASILLEKD